MRTAKAVVMSLLLVLSCGLTYYFHAELEMGAIFTHFFYVPIVLACIWWKRRGLVVAVFLAALLIISHYAVRSPLVSVNDYFRAFMFIAIGFVVAVLSERIARQAERIKHLNAVLRAIRNVNQLIVREKDRDRLIQGACDSLIETRGYHNLWIAVLDKAGSVVMTAEGGLGAHFLPMIERLRSTGLPPCGLKALKQSGVVVTADPSSECTDCPLSGVDSGGAGMAVWLKHGDVVHGILSVSIPAELSKNVEEQNLLREVAGDIAFALHDIELTRQHELAEEALRENEKKLSQIVEGTAIPLFVIDKEHTVTHWNKACENLTGISASEMVGVKKQWSAFYPAERPVMADFVVDELSEEEISKYYGNKYQKSILVQGAYEVENFFPTLGDSGKWLFFTAAPLRDYQGKVIGAIETLQDITDRKQEEQERAELQEQLRQSQKMEAIGRLAGGIAHDFRNQLTVIKGFTEMLLRQSLVADEGRDKIAEVLKAVDRSTKLTGQLLTFSRKERLEPQVVDLSDLMADMSKSLSRMIGEDIRLSVKPAGRPCRANVDPNLLQQAIMNLVVNARAAMPNGGDLTIETDVVDLDAESVRRRLGAKQGKYAVIFIEDTGDGMDEVTQNHIFEPFFTTKQVGEGTGLGLSMVYGLVEQSGGFIKCESEPGKGTKFSVYLPKVDQPAAEAGPVIETRKPLQGSETILVVEDEEPVRRMLVESLREGGYCVLEASNSAEALPLGEHLEDPIDMLVTDVVMPGMNGVELAERIKAARPGIAVLFVSGYAQGELSRRGTNYVRGNLLLVKPFSHEALLRRIRQVLDGASSHDAD